ncbi:MAG: ferrous iron transporter B, partial [Oscillospiraceae bacterium]|nr:ferrous iron transporter B [Oscillospiraceae bacterium]
WFLQSFDFHFNLVQDTQDSILASIAGLIAPIMRPAGLGDWRIVTSLVSGFMAKESVVATMQLLFSAEGLTTALSGLAAAAMLVFSLLYTPCVAAIASIKRELGGKWAAGVIIWQCAIAWVAAVLVTLAGTAFGL